MLFIICIDLIDFIMYLSDSSLFVLILILDNSDIFWELLANLPELANLLL